MHSFPGLLVTIWFKTSNFICCSWAKDGIQRWVDWLKKICGRWYLIPSFPGLLVTIWFKTLDFVCCNWAGDGIQRWKICSFHFLAFWSPFDVRHRILFVVVELEMEIKWKERRGNKMKGKERFCGRWYWCLLFLASWSPSDVRHQILFAMVKPKRGFQLWVDGLKEVLADYIWCFLFLAVWSPSDVRHRILFAIVKLKLGFGVDRLVGKFCSGYHLMLSFPWYCWGWDSVLIGWGNSETDNIWGFLFLASWYKTLIFVCCGLVQEI